MEKVSPTIIHRDGMIADSQYIEWLKELKQRYVNTQAKAAVQVNSSMLSFYWSLGKDIMRMKAESTWGNGFFNQLSMDLRHQFKVDTGFSVTNIKYMKRWVEFYVEDALIRQQAVDELDMPADFASVSWSQHIKIFSKCKDTSEAMFYIHKTIEGSWSRAVLDDNMASHLYERQGNAITNFSAKAILPQGKLAEEILKDPYDFNFLRMKAGYDEHDFEGSSWVTIAKAASEHYESYVHSSFGDSTNLSLAKNEIDQALLLFNTGTEPKDIICYLQENSLTNKKLLFGNAGEIYANFDKEKSLEYFKLSQFYRFNEWITDISTNEDKEKNYFNDKRSEGVTAYKFRACSPHLFADLANNEITLSRPHCMNDPFDSLYSIWSEEDNLTNVLTDKKHISMFKKSFDYYRFCSFCIDDAAENTILGNILMWSHYANEHRGICIKYKLKGNCINTDCSDDIDDVRPQALLHRINYKKVEPLSLQKKSIQIGLAFAHKHPCWEYEKEARLISYDATKEGDRYTIPYNEGISIEAIYFGLNCSKDDKTIIKKILDDENIEYYDMKCNYGDVYRMDIKSE